MDQELVTLQNKYLNAVYSTLGNIVPNAVRDSKTAIHALLRYHLGWENTDGTISTTGSGKALRPLLCLMACDMAGGNWEKALPAAASLELVHNFSLIHDDIQDHDLTRRGRDTTWSVWGIPKAVSAGNAMRVLADQSILNLSSIGISDHTATSASLLLTSRYMEMIEGQYLDMSFEQMEFVSTSDYLDMISRKTGALIQSSMQLGALVATEDQKTAELFGECGRLLGLAFQVRDDYLGVWGDPNVFGKPVGSDIKRKKKALPAVYALQEAHGKDLDALRSIYGLSVLGDAEVQTVMDIMETVKTADYVQETASNYAYKSLQPLSELGLPPSDFRLVRNLAEFFAKRSR